MKLSKVLSAIIVTGAMYAQAAVAQPQALVETLQIPLGQSSVNVEVQYNGNPTGTAGEFRVTFNDTDLDVDIAATCPTPAVWGCSHTPGSGFIQFASGFFPAGGLPDFAGDVVFDTTSAQLGTYPLTVTNELYTQTDVMGSVDPVGTTNGAIEVLGPTYSSSPAPGALDVGSAISGGTDPQTVVNISNSGAGTLDVTCTDTTGMGSVFSVSPNTPFSVDAGDPAVGVTVSCDADNPADTYTGTMSCTHNGGAGGESSPAVYNLSCTITAGPQPAYSSTPVAGSSINLSATNQGDPITPASLLISNSGDAGTTLDGTCSFGMAPPQLSVSDGSFSLAQGASETQFISCDSAAEGTYNATLTCTHDGSNGPSASYPVECVVGAPRPAVYSSTPPDGSTVEMTAGFDGGEAPVGATIPDSDLVITNTAAAGAEDLDLSCNVVSPPQAGISVSPDLSAPFTVAPGASATATFSCGSATAGNYTVAYVCDWATEGEGIPQETGTASYTYNCDVRAAESSVSTSPVSGSTLTELAQPDGTGTFEVVFSEDNDEGLPGSLESCTLVDGTNFAITAPTFAAPIPAGGSVTVTVVGTDPGDAESITDTLNCTYTDSDNDSPPANVTYDLVMEIGGGGNFTVTKDFSDDNPAPVTVTLTCDTGLPLVQSFEITESTSVDFVVTDYESGAMNCSVTETPVAGYATTYAPSGDSASDDVDGCNFTAVSGGDSNACVITNSVIPVDVDITKVWEVMGAGGDEIDMGYTLTLTCNAVIVGGLPVEEPDAPVNGYPLYYQVFNGMGNDTFTAQVIPNLPYSICTVIEETVEINVEADNGCENIQVSVGNGAACTITNTVFFEAIPTLSQWGMAIMALLMLGVGMVGFRRFA